MTAEELRLEESKQRTVLWKRWGPYLSERAWGTVREDYSPDGAAWDFLPFDAARSKAFRWNEDGLGGICDRFQKICFSVALWNGKDPFLKERLFGLSGPQGNHGEDVKEYYFYLDSTPTHSYMKFLYKYPQAEFPYRQLIEENQRRDKSQPEFELLDTGIFDENKYFDVFIEYAKATDKDICIKISAHNRGDEAAPLHILPTIWFRNTWAWDNLPHRPQLKKDETSLNLAAIRLDEVTYGNRWLYCEGSSSLVFCDNETNLKRLYNAPNLSPFVKDGINDYVVNGNFGAINAQQRGTKAAAHNALMIPAHGVEEVYLRFTSRELTLVSHDTFIADCAEVFAKRQREADEFYQTVIPAKLSADAKNVQRQALAGMLWSKQFYHYDVKKWLDGDSAQPKPPASRKTSRNSTWLTLNNEDVISMPDAWEYPWYAAWDLAFHCIPLALVDAEFAKQQLILLVREWYMHPNGQLPAYEWKFDDVNPPVHAWAALRVYQIEAKRTDKPDRVFLEKIFHKLLINFTWWTNRKDSNENNIFEGGFLGLDNIGVFDRSSILPTGGHIEQSDGTSWMAMYCLNMLAIALELAKENHAYEDVATKFFEHFIYIADAMNNIGEENVELWNARDGFFYDVLHLPDNTHLPLKVRSMVGLIPLFAVETLESEWLDDLPEFKKRMNWFLTNRPELIEQIEDVTIKGVNNRRILALVDRDKLRRILRVMLDETEFLSDHGIRALSRFHKNHPYILPVNGTEHRVDYEPAESSTGLFGGNSNWRGPIWFPVNYLLIESLQKFDYFFGENFKIECPTGSEQMMTLWEVSQELSRRLSRIFLQDDDGKRPVFGNLTKFQTDEHWRNYILFHEYFHGDNGAGLGASHQTGWTGLVAKLLQQSGE